MRKPNKPTFNLWPLKLYDQSKRINVEKQNQNSTKSFSKKNKEPKQQNNSQSNQLLPRSLGCDSNTALSFLDSGGSGVRARLMGDPVSGAVSSGSGVVGRATGRHSRPFCSEARAVSAKRSGRRAAWLRQMWLCTVYIYTHISVCVLLSYV